MNPEVLILDEPTTFLDPPGRRELAAVLNRLRQSRIVVTHEVPFARQTTQRAVFFENGSVVADNSVDEVVRRFEWE